MATETPNVVLNNIFLKNFTVIFAFYILDAKNYKRLRHKIGRR